MLAASLPLELQQEIFSFLDTKSFYAARHVCRWWRLASCDSVTLSRQLEKIPARSSTFERGSTSIQDLHKLLNNAAHILMLGMRSDGGTETQASLSSACPFGEHARTTTNRSGSRTVALNDRIITLYDTSSNPPIALARRMLNDLKETVGVGPWLKITPISAHELALSSDGRLLAIAQERTIQIYDLLDDPASWTLNQYIYSAAGHFICGLDFEQDDFLLRVRLSGKGTVLYLGSTPGEGDERKTSDLQHWRSEAGLKHFFLSSSLINLSSENPSEDRSAHISGLQLLDRFRDGYIFAAQRHGGGESSHYILAHVKIAKSRSTTTLSAEHGSVIELVRLESYLSSRNYALSGTRVWENMPCAHEHHPRFSLSAGILVLAEKDKKCVRPRAVTHVYAYRLPGESTIIKQLEEKRQNRPSQHPDGIVFNPSGCGRDFNVARMPLSIGTVRGEVVDVSCDVTHENKTTFLVTVSTGDAIKSWALEHL